MCAYERVCACVCVCVCVLSMSMFVCVVGGCVFSHTTSRRFSLNTVCVRCACVFSQCRDHQFYRVCGCVSVRGRTWENVCGVFVWARPLGEHSLVTWL